MEFMTLISETKKNVVCGTGDKTSTVLKVSIDDPHQPIIWKHEGHTSSIFIVRISEDQKYVLSSRFDRQLILAKENDGEILSKFNGFSSNLVNKVIRCPDNKSALPTSSHEVVLVKMESEQLKKVEKVKRESLGFVCINEMNAFWGSKTETSPFLLLGEHFPRNTPSQVAKLHFK